MTKKSSRGILDGNFVTSHMNSILSPLEALKEAFANCLTEPTKDNALLLRERLIAWVKHRNLPQESMWMSLHKEDFVPGGSKMRQFITSLIKFLKGEVESIQPFTEETELETVPVMA